MEIPSYAIVYPDFHFYNSLCC